MPVSPSISTVVGTAPPARAAPSTGASPARDHGTPRACPRRRGAPSCFRPRERGAPCRRRVRAFPVGRICAQHTHDLGRVADERPVARARVRQQESVRTDRDLEVIARHVAIAEHELVALRSADGQPFSFRARGLAGVGTRCDVDRDGSHRERCDLLAARRLFQGLIISRYGAHHSPSSCTRLHACRSLPSALMRHLLSLVALVIGCAGEAAPASSSSAPAVQASATSTPSTPSNAAPPNTDSGLPASYVEARTAELAWEGRMRAAMARNAACSAIADEVTRLTREIEPIMRRFRDEGAKLDEKQQRSAADALVAADVHPPSPGDALKACAEKNDPARDHDDARVGTCPTRGGRERSTTPAAPRSDIRFSTSRENAPHVIRRRNVP